MRSNRLSGRLARGDVESGPGARRRRARRTRNPGHARDSQLLALLASDPHALYTSISRLSELHIPEESEIPDVDVLVADHFAREFPDCTERSVLRKTKPMSAQCKRLLAVLRRDLGIAVPLPELLLANGLRPGTPRRLRELETEHGSFKMRTFSKDRVQRYILADAHPDVNACARYWIKANLRESSLPQLGGSSLC